MNTNEELKLSSFRNEQEKSIVNILFTNNYISYRINELFKNFNITKQQYNVLRILQDSAPKTLTVGEIKSRMLDVNSDITRIVKRLEQKALVVLTPDENDRRLVQVSNSESGEYLLNKIARLSERLGSPLSQITDHEARELNRILEKIRTN